TSHRGFRFFVSWKKQRVNMYQTDQIKKLTEERDAWRTVAAALLKLVPEAEPAMREAGVLRTVHDDLRPTAGTPMEKAHEGLMSYKEYVEWYALNFPGETPMDRNTYLTNVLGYDPPSERDYTVGDAVGLKRQPLDELKRQRLDSQSFQD